MNRIKCSAKVVCLILFVLLWTGCAKVTPHRLYEGAQLPASEIAILRNADYVNRNVHILTIDGEPGNIGGLMFAEDIYNDPLSGKYFIELLPGKHTISVQYVNLSYRAPHHTVVEYDFKAGRVYEIRTEFIKTDRGLFPNELKLWIEDITDANAS